MSVQYNARNSFDRFYLYMRNLGRRYNRSVEVLQIDIERIADEKMSMSVEEASNILSLAIQ